MLFRNFMPAPVQRAALTLALCAAAATTPALAQAPATATPPEADARLVWDLTRLFPNDAAWDAERQAVLAEVGSLRNGAGTLGTDAAALRAVLDRHSALSQRVQRLWVFASTQSSTDQRNRRNQERMALMGALWGQVSSATAWVDPEVQTLGAAKVEAFIKAEPGLARHERRLRDVLRLAPHTLAAAAESALAAQAPVLANTSGVRSLLVDSDIQWPSIQVGERSVRVSETGYQELREHPDRAVRQRAFDAFYGTYGQYENTFGALLAQRVQAGVTNARLRQYPSAVAASLAPFDIPEAVVRQLVAQVNEGLPALHRYFKLRQRLLKLPDLAYHDIYPDMLHSERRFGPEESAALTLAAVKPLGDEVQGLLKLALQSRTMHLRPAQGKSSGAYQTSVYGQLPFVFMNHRDSYESLTTYAHEWGHGLHTMLSQRTQPFETAGYSLFLAEVASMSNERLLEQHMLDQAATKDERIFVLGRVLEQIRAGFYRQAMFAEFELAAHDAQQRGEALSGKRFTQIYCDLLRKYHGAEAGVMSIDPKVCVEWAYIPHFYRPFYVFAYATSITAANHFGTRILAGQPGMRERYLDVLRAGSSLAPHQLLLRAGLDLTQPEPYRELVRRMNTVMDEMERLLAS